MAELLDLKGNSEKPDSIWQWSEETEQVNSNAEGLLFGGDIPATKNRKGSAIAKNGQLASNDTHLGIASLLAQISVIDKPQLSLVTRMFLR